MAPNLVDIAQQVIGAILELPTDWHANGTVPDAVLPAILKYAGNLPFHRSAETGTGRTTLLLSNISSNHTVFAVPGASSHDAVLNCPILNRAAVTFVDGPSQLTLPAHRFGGPLDFALLDGPHGYPFPELEYYYIYPHLSTGALLVIDDIHIPTVHNLFSFLREDEMFELLGVVDQTAFFRRTAAPTFSPDGDGWWLQKYNSGRFPMPLGESREPQEYDSQGRYHEPDSDVAARLEAIQEQGRKPGELQAAYAAKLAEIQGQSAEIAHLMSVVRDWQEHGDRLMRELGVLHAALDAVQRSHTYRMLERLGRWKWLGRALSETTSVQDLACLAPPTQLVASQQYIPEDPRAYIASVLGDRDSFPFWEACGFHVTPAHFYSPIPTVSSLPEGLWERESEMVGIELNEPAQLAFLEDVCSRFKTEYDTFPLDPTEVPYEYYFNQMMFRSVDAEVYYCMVRHHLPRRIIEVGSGYSTRVAAAAIRRNIEEGHRTELIAIEPYPSDILRQGMPGLARLVETTVQDVDLSVFQALGANDILFIDSSHVVRTGSDVCLLVLEILPRLRSGVLVHFHDVFLPKDYPREWVTKEHRFWSEQYLLQAFLAHNSAFEIAWAGSYMRTHHSEELNKLFASYDSATTRPGSLWIRRLPE